MARISAYPTDTTISGLDRLIGTDAEDANITKNFKISDLANYFSGPLGYTSLVQLLNQTGTDAPVATEVYNNTGETYNWSYVDNGVYRITSTGTPFAVNKTIVFGNLGATNLGSLRDLAWNRISDSVIDIRSSQDGSLINASFEIKIYS